jgi:hypothetical protein
MARPTALGLFLCDQVIIDRETGKRTLVGLFDVLRCPEIPYTVPPFAVSAALTDGQGQCVLDLVVSDIDTAEQLAVASAQVDFDNPLALFHVRFRFPALSFPVAGQYLFELFADDEPICHRRLHVQLSEETM